MTWAAEADKCDVAHEDALHAMVNAICIETSFDDPRPPATVSPTLDIGPQRDRSAPLFEVMGGAVPPRGGRRL